MRETKAAGRPIKKKEAKNYQLDKKEAFKLIVYEGNDIGMEIYIDATEVDEDSFLAECVIESESAYETGKDWDKMVGSYSLGVKAALCHALKWLENQGVALDEVDADIELSDFDWFEALQEKRELGWF